MKRTAHIEALDFRRIKITTFAKQKIFDLSQLGLNKYIDLITFKISDILSNFYTKIYVGKGSMIEPYAICVVGRVSEDTYDTLDNVVVTVAKDVPATWVRAYQCKKEHTFSVVIPS